MGYDGPYLGLEGVQRISTVMEGGPNVLNCNGRESKGLHLE